MSITVYPYKLTRKVLEARLPPGLSVSPGQWLRFEGNPPFYGQIREVFLMPSGVAGMPEAYGARIDLPEGCPDLSPRAAVLLTPESMAREATRLQEPLTYPLRLSEDLACELDRLGSLTLIAGGDLTMRLEALRLLITAIQPHRKVVVIDPLGIPTSLSGHENGITTWRAGQDIRLSLRSVGDRRLLDAFGALFPEHLRETVLRAIADHLPVMGGFTPFQKLMSLESADPFPLKNLILQHYQAIASTGVFADQPEQTFHPSRLPPRQAALIDLSGLPAPWKELFYEQALQACLSDADCIPVLICPERCLTDTADWVRKAETVGIRLIILASSRPESALYSMADNLMSVETDGKLCIQGKLTHGLPVRLSLPVSNSGLSFKPAVFRSEAAIFPEAEPLRETSMERFREIADTTSAKTIEELPETIAPQPDILPLAWSVSSAVPARNPEAIPTAGPSDARPGRKKIMEDFAPPSTSLKPSMEASGEPFGEASEEKWSRGISAMFSSEEAEASAEAEPEHPSTPENPLEAHESFDDIGTVLNLKRTPPGAPSNPVTGEPGGFLSPESLHEIMVSSASDEVLTQADTDKEEKDEKAQQSEDFLPAAATSEETPEISAELAEEEHFEKDFFEEFPLPDFRGAEPASADLDEDNAPPLPSDQHPSNSETDMQHFEPDAEPASEPVAEPFVTEPVVPAAEEAEPEFPTLSLGDSEPTVTLPEVSAYEEFSFELEPDDFGQPANGNGQGNLSSWGPSAVRSTMDLADAEMQEALDLIFPPYPDRKSGAEGGTKAEKTITEKTTTIMQSSGQPSEEASEAFSRETPESPPEKAASEPDSIPVLSSRLADIAEPFNPAGFRVGDRVTHPTYGAGVVQRMIPMEDSIILNITFDRVGKRLLDPALCPALRLEARQESQAG